MTTPHIMFLSNIGPFIDIAKIQSGAVLSNLDMYYYGKITQTQSFSLVRFYVIHFAAIQGRAE